MRAPIFLIFLCSFFFCKGENSTVNRAPLGSAEYSLTQNDYIVNQGVNGNFDQYNKIIEDIDNGEDNLSSDTISNKFVSLNFQTVAKWQITNSNFFYHKDSLKGIKNFQPLFGFSQPIYIIIKVLRI